MPEDVDLQQIKELVRLVEQNKLAELTVEENGVTITVKGADVASTTQIQPEQPVHLVHEEVDYHDHVEEVAPAAPEQEHGNLVSIEAPMVGVFYRSPSPDSPPFIDVGDVIEIGHTIGLIEAMKVFSEIPSEVAGEVVEIPCESGKLVQQGQPLVVVRTA